MNQKQADNLVKLIEYFESVPEDNVALNYPGYVSMDVDKTKFDPESMTIKVQECGSTFCLAGHLPYAFPELYTEKKEILVYGDVIKIDYDYPDCKGFPTEWLYCDGPVTRSFEKHFGIKDDILESMVKNGKHPYDHLDSDKEAVLKFLRDKLDEHGYEIAEVTA